MPGETNPKLFHTQIKNMFSAGSASATNSPLAFMEKTSSATLELLKEQTKSNKALLRAILEQTKVMKKIDTSGGGSGFLAGLLALPFIRRAGLFLKGGLGLLARLIRPIATLVTGISVFASSGLMKVIVKTTHALLKYGPLLTKGLAKFAWPVTALLGLIDGISGFMNANQILGTQGKIGLWRRIEAAKASILNGLLLGIPDMVSKKLTGRSMAKFVDDINMSIYNKLKGVPLYVAKRTVAGWNYIKNGFNRAWEAIPLREEFNKFAESVKNQVINFGLRINNAFSDFFSNVTTWFTDIFGGITAWLGKKRAEIQGMDYFVDKKVEDMVRPPPPGSKNLQPRDETPGRRKPAAKPAEQSSLSWSESIANWYSGSPSVPKKQPSGLSAPGWTNQTTPNSPEFEALNPGYAGAPVTSAPLSTPSSPVGAIDTPTAKNMIDRTEAEMRAQRLRTAVPNYLDNLYKDGINLFGALGTRMSETFAEGSGAVVDEVEDSMEKNTEEMTDGVEEMIKDTSSEFYDVFSKMSKLAFNQFKSVFSKENAKALADILSGNAQDFDLGAALSGMDGGGSSPSSDYNPFPETADPNATGEPTAPNVMPGAGGIQPGTPEAGPNNEILRSKRGSRMGNIWKKMGIDPATGKKLEQVQQFAGQEARHEVMNEMMKHGASKKKAAAIAGNMNVESNFDPNILGDSGSALGLMQWRKERRANLMKFAKENGLDYRDRKTQARFALEEGNPTSKYADAGSVRAQKWIDDNPDATPGEMARKFGKHAERPNEFYAHYDKRAKSADRYFNEPMGTATTKPPAGAFTNTPTAGYSNGGVQEKQNVLAGIRKAPLADDLKRNIDLQLLKTFGPGYRAEVYSGGQNDKTGRTGTRRHNDGGAGDMKIFGPDGKQISQADYARFGQGWLAERKGSIGLQMKGGGIHVDKITKYGKGEGPYWSYNRKGGKFNLTAANKELLRRGYEDREKPDYKMTEEEAIAYLMTGASGVKEAKPDLADSSLFGALKREGGFKRARIPSRGPAGSPVTTTSSNRFGPIRASSGVGAGSILQSRMETSRQIEQFRTADSLLNASIDRATQPRGSVDDTKKPDDVSQPTAQKNADRKALQVKTQSPTPTQLPGKQIDNKNAGVGDSLVNKSYAGMPSIEAIPTTDELKILAINSESIN